MLSKCMFASNVYSIKCNIKATMLGVVCVLPIMDVTKHFKIIALL